MISRFRKFIPPMSLLIFLALTFVGACFLRLRILEMHMVAAMDMQDNAAVRSLLESWPCPVNARREDGDTVLMWAFWLGDNETVRRCVLRGARLEARDAGGLTPLLLAALKGDRALVEFLLAHGADVKARTPVPDEGKRETRYLGHYCGPSTPGKTPLHLAIESSVYQRFHGPDRAMCEMLIANGADVNARDSNGQTPLYEAAYQRSLDVTALLISKGADVNARDFSDWTPLHLAAVYGADDVAKLLIDKGADINAANKAGRTALVLAVGNSRYGVAELLRKAGAKE